MINKIQKLKNKKGFTLVELIVVIAIIAVLTAVIVPLIGQYSAQAAYTALQDNAKTISDDINTCLSDYTAKGNPAACTRIRGIKQNGGDLQVGFEGATAAEEAALRVKIKDSLNATLPGFCCFTADIKAGAVEGVIYSDSAIIVNGTVSAVDAFKNAYTMGNNTIGTAGKYETSGAVLSPYSGGTLS